MLEQKLNLVPLPCMVTLPDRVVVQPKTRKELIDMYCHVANLKTIPDLVDSPERDIGKIIHLRPDYLTSTVSSIDLKTHLVKKGYHSWGKKDNDLVNFEIYSPHPSVKPNFPPKTLRNTIGLFVLRLIEEGYQIPPKALEFLKKA